MLKLLILNGPNLNLLGVREPDHYGVETLDNINDRLGGLAEADGVQLLTHQDRCRESGSRSCRRMAVWLRPVGPDRCGVSKESRAFGEPNCMRVAGVRKRIL